MKLICIMAMAIVPWRLLAQSNTIEVSPESSVDWWAAEIVTESLSLSNAKPILKLTHTTAHSQAHLQRLGLIFRFFVKLLADAKLHALRLALSH